jgi:hypothetical protein
MTRFNNKPRSEAFPKRLFDQHGGHFGPSYSVALEKGCLTYSHRRSGGTEPPSPWEPSKEIKPSAKQGQTFRRALDRLNVWCWQEDYLDPGVCDGTNWSVEIAYTDKAIVSGGSNCFPGRNGGALGIVTERNDETSAKFCCAAARLVGQFSTTAHNIR